MAIRPHTKSSNLPKQRSLAEESSAGFGVKNFHDDSRQMMNHVFVSIFLTMYIDI